MDHVSFIFISNCHGFCRFCLRHNGILYKNACPKCIKWWTQFEIEQVATELGLGPDYYRRPDVYSVHSDYQDEEQNQIKKEEENMIGHVLLAWFLCAWLYLACTNRY
jgi:hypothetical protein